MLVHAFCEHLGVATGLRQTLGNERQW